MKSLSPDFIKPNTVLFVKAPNDIKHANGLAGDHLEKGQYEHPCLVISTVDQDDTVEVCFITSLSSQTVQERHPNNATQRSRYVAIAPSSASKEVPYTFSLEEGCRPLEKNSYLEAFRRYQIHISNLDFYCHRSNASTRLSQASFDKLLAEQKKVVLAQPSANAWIPRRNRSTSSGSETSVASTTSTTSTRSSWRPSSPPRSASPPSNVDWSKIGQRRSQCA